MFLASFRQRDSWIRCHAKWSDVGRGKTSTSLCTSSATRPRAPSRPPPAPVRRRTTTIDATQHQLPSHDLLPSPIQGRQGIYPRRSHRRRRLLHVSQPSGLPLPLPFPSPPSARASLHVACLSSALSRGSMLTAPHSASQRLYGFESPNIYPRCLQGHRALRRSRPRRKG